MTEMYLWIELKLLKVFKVCFVSTQVYKTRMKESKCLFSQLCGREEKNLNGNE